MVGRVDQDGPHLLAGRRLHQALPAVPMGVAAIQPVAGGGKQDGHVLRVNGNGVDVEFVR